MAETTLAPTAPTATAPAPGAPGTPAPAGPAPAAPGTPEATPEALAADPIAAFRAEVAARAEALGIDPAEVFARDAEIKSRLAASRKQAKEWARKVRAAERLQAESQSRMTELEQLQAEVKRYRENPLDALDAAGIPLSEYFNRQHEAELRNNDPIWQELQALKAQLTEKEQAQQSKAQEAQRATQVQAVATVAQDLLQKKATEYGHLNAYIQDGAIEASAFFQNLASEIVDLYHRDGVDTDLDEVFAAYDARCKAEIDRIAKLAEVTRQAPGSRAVTTNSSQSAQLDAPALTNRAASGGSTMQKPDPRDAKAWFAYLQNLDK